MRKIFTTVLVMVSIPLLFFTGGCKTSEESIDLFSIAAATGYAKHITTLDPDDTGVITLNLFFAVHNQSDVAGTITGWSFKIRHNIVNLAEVNNLNYQNYRLVVTGDMVIPAKEIREFFINTPQPFLENALTKNELSFDPYIPTKVIVDLELRNDNGEIFQVTAQGTFTYEESQLNESKYNILGDWEFNRVVSGQAQAKQEIDFVGTRQSGRYAIYKWGTATVEETGSYAVANYKYFTLTADTGGQYWGEFTDETHANGTLMIPATKNQVIRTGTFTAKKI